MQLDSAPLCAADIAPELRRQFAFLSGDTPLDLALPQFVCFLIAELQTVDRSTQIIIMANFSSELVAYVHDASE